MQRVLGVVSIILLIIPSSSIAQRNPLQAEQLSYSTSDIFNSLKEKSGFFEEEINNTLKHYIKRLERQEIRIKRKLSTKVDSVVLESLFADSDSICNYFNSQIAQAQGFVIGKTNFYIPLLDTIRTSLNFIGQSNMIPSFGGDLNSFNTALSAINSLQGKLNQSETLRKIISSRKELLKEKLEAFGLLKELKKFNKDYYYLDQTLTEYKSIVNDPERMASVALRFLQKIPAFCDFFKRHSEIASLFRLPGTDPIDPTILQGLQTREMVLQSMETSMGPNIQQSIGQSLTNAEDQLRKAKDKIFSDLSKKDQDDFRKTEGFRPNSRRKKSFRDNLELGFNIQNNRSNNFFPVSSDIGLSAGIKPNEKLIAGLGLSGRIGWGPNVQNISISYQGMGLRSFVEYNIKSGFRATAGFEMIYRSEIRNFDQLRQFSAWQQSGLIGLTKVISLQTKFLKNTRLSFMWDYLSYQQVPRAKPLLLRFGYAF